MKRWCPKCQAWVMPMRDLLVWFCPGCSDELKAEPEPEEPDDGDDLDERQMEVF